MDTLKYKTNLDDINGATEVRKILDNDEDIQYWYLDIMDENHSLTLTGEHLEAEKIKRRLEEAGFQLAEI
jgi:hypothetical protein